MLGSKCELKSEIWVYPPPTILGPNTAFFRRLRNLTANLTAYICEAKHGTHNRATALITTGGLLRRPKMSWTLVHKRLKIEPPFLPTLRKFGISSLGFADGDQQTELNQTLPNGGQLIGLTFCRIEKSGSSLQKLGGAGFYICAFFR